MMASEVQRFRDRREAGLLLAERFRGRSLRDPLVLAIPRGGVAIGAVLVRELRAELDVILSRKLRAPFQPELAVGAVTEDGQVILHSASSRVPGLSADYLEREIHQQLAEIARRKSLVRGVRPAAAVTGRSVIVTDDGIATGSTMLAALRTVRAQSPFEMIVAVPVAAPERLAEVRRAADEVVCLIAPEDLQAVGFYYDDFDAVEDGEVLQLLREALAPRPGAS